MKEITFAVEIPEGYEDVHPELLGEDVFAGKEWVRWRVVEDRCAAAPDLLALLKELIDIEGPQPGAAAWADKVRAAIAKAEGK